MVKVIESLCMDCLYRHFYVENGYGKFICKSRREEATYGRSIENITVVKCDSYRKVV